VEGAEGGRKFRSGTDGIVIRGIISRRVFMFVGRKQAKRSLVVTEFQRRANLRG
jgi:hypothetical protein